MTSRSILRTGPGTPFSKLTFALLAAACSHPAPPAPPAPQTPPPAAQTPPPTPAAPARQAPPPPLPERPVQFPPFHEAALPNGLRLIVVEKHDLPVVNVDLYVQAGDASDTQARAGLASMTADMLTKGTRTRSAKEIATLIESAGGQLDASSGADYSTISSTALKAQLPLLFDLVSDVALHPTFPSDELATARKRAISGLQANLGEASFVAQRIFSRALYGQTNPYGFLETPQTLQAITRADIQRFYREHYEPGDALLVVSGDVDAASIEQMARKAFGAWQGKGSQPITMPAPPTVDSTHILLVNRPGSVQSNILVGDVTFRPDDPDFYPLQVLNQIVGGGSNARLFRILREEKGWTYGAYSELSRPRDVGYFVASAEVRTPVTDSSLTEMLAQLRRVRTEPVADSELASAKSFLVGSFPLRLQTAGQVARQVARTRLLGLPLEGLTQYREKIQAVTATDVQRVARQYVRPDQALVVVVGDAAALYPKLRDIAPTSVLDVEGKPVDAASLEVKGASEKLGTSTFQPMTLVYQFDVNGSPVGTNTLALTREGDAWVATTDLQAAVATQHAELRFTSDFTPISASQSVHQGPVAITSDLKFAGGKVTGTADLPAQMGGKKTFDKAVPPGTLLPGMDQFAIMAADLAPGKTLTLPVFSALTGDAQNYTAKVVGEESVTVPAGTFDTYKIELTGQQSSTLHVRKQAPHIVVKQEPAGAPVSIELKEVR